jgi:SAM-dependent methyltransferase
VFNRSPRSNRAAVEVASLSADDRFLDIGCGPGAALEYAAATGAQVAGVDPSPSMVSRASKRVPAAEVKVGSAEEIPFPDEAFTVVINVSSFHHWADSWVTRLRQGQAGDGDSRGLSTAKNPEGVQAEASTLSGFSTQPGLLPRRVGLPVRSSSGLSTIQGPSQGCP